MLTRLRVRGFKNLEDVEVYFGPFTCIAGSNAVGKSNLFDAILFLSSLADTPILEAALSVRDKSGHSTDIRSLFHRTSAGAAAEMAFEVDILLPSGAVDDLGQRASPAISLVSYALRLQLHGGDDSSLRPTLEVAFEELTYIPREEAEKRIRFDRSAAWFRSALRGRRTSPFISTETQPNGSTIRLHQEGRSGRPRDFRGSTLPRTVLSTVNAVESPTALVARREMQSWRLLQLEPTALRASDTFTATPQLGADGSHLPATLYALARGAERETNPALRKDVEALVSARLSELVDDVDSVHVERDERREILTLTVTDTTGTTHAARALSDGTLRFLALTVLEVDPSSHGLLCFEEPENGIHPRRITAMVRLLRDLTFDPTQPLGLDNPLRQVIVNTHSPNVVAEVPADSLLFAERVNKPVGKTRTNTVVFRPLDRTWRARISGAPLPVQKGEVIAYLTQSVLNREAKDPPPTEAGFERVVDRSDIGQLLLWQPPSTEPGK
jgi:predicted ATPase